MFESGKDRTAMGTFRSNHSDMVRWPSDGSELNTTENFRHAFGLTELELFCIEKYGIILMSRCRKTGIDKH